MKDYNDKILRGSEIRGDQLRLPRALAIYRAVNKHEYAEIVKCQRNTSQDEILSFRLKRLQIPEYPEYSIRTEETVAVVCHKFEETWPDVYALRNDFPLGLPHSNAKPYKRPVSICVVDYFFTMSVCSLVHMILSIVLGVGLRKTVQGSCMRTIDHWKYL